MDFRFTLEGGEHLQVVVKHSTREALAFEDTQMGKTLYIAQRWEDKKGLRRPPSPIQARVMA